ncbi:hypothetical protein EYF80_042805 [Liparis tanakae]|uniref:Uncharacterized protein n=1 Tax=Liparis tanakae TaxID=230148 RepID=A0A4Z2G386_9TELE|nr:hypothetical protein EYF80_042805 [Liparis tanakae]
MSTDTELLIVGKTGHDGFGDYGFHLVPQQEVKLSALQPRQNLNQEPDEASASLMKMELRYPPAYRSPGPRDIRDTEDVRVQDRVKGRLGIKSSSVASPVCGPEKAAEGDPAGVGDRSACPVGCAGLLEAWFTAAPLGSGLSGAELCLTPVSLVQLAPVLVVVAWWLFPTTSLPHPPTCLDVAAPGPTLPTDPVTGLAPVLAAAPGPRSGPPSAPGLAAVSTASVAIPLTLVLLLFSTAAFMSALICSLVT